MKNLIVGSGCVTLTHISHKSSGMQVWRRSAATSIATGFLVLVSSFWTLCLVRYYWRERYTISWLSVGSGTSSKIILSIKVMVLMDGCMSMVG